MTASPRTDFCELTCEISKSLGDEAVALEGATLREEEPTSLLWEAPHNPDGGRLISCNFAIPRLLFERIGRFDERLSGGGF